MRLERGEYAREIPPLPPPVRTTDNSCRFTHAMSQAEQKESSPPGPLKPQSQGWGRDGAFLGRKVAPTCLQKEPRICMVYGFVGRGQREEWILEHPCPLWLPCIYTGC